MWVIVGYNVSVLLIIMKSGTPEVSNCQKAMRELSGLQRKPSRILNSSS